MKKTLYLYKSGKLVRNDNSLKIEYKNGACDYIPIMQIDIILCFCEMDFNKRVLELLNQYEVCILFFNFYSKYIGRFVPKQYQDGKILLQQVRCYQNESLRVYVSKQMEIASCINMLALLKYYLKKERNTQQQIEQIETNVGKIKRAKSVDELLIVEAQIKQIYYSAFDLIIQNDDFKFERRSKNPPLNAINAMLSYGYALLYATFLSTLDRSSLNPQISFIHSLSKSTDSLQYDLADIFKPVLIDRLVIRLIRKRQIQKKHFEYKEDGRCYLNKDGIAIMVTAFDDQLAETIKINNKAYSYKSLISLEVHKLSEYVKGKSIKYSPYKMRW